MNYSTYFSTNTTDYIAKDLIGRMLTFDNGQEKLGGYIVEAEAYMGKKDRAAHSYGGVVVAQRMKDFTAKAERSISTRNVNIFSLILPLGFRMNHRVF